MVNDLYEEEISKVIGQRNELSKRYLAPQKREPAMTGREMYQRGYAAAERDLKREPLSDDWIKDNIHLIHQDVSFTDLVRSIEKAHGIGVNDE
jgi:hypothetical protein